VAPSAIFSQNAGLDEPEAVPATPSPGAPSSCTLLAVPSTHPSHRVLRRSVESVQYLAIRYTERRDQIGAVTSVGSIGDSCDNAAAESLIGLFKTELIRCRGPWRGLDHVRLATLEWADWFNNRWLYSAYGNVPPVEYEQQHDRHIAALETFETAESSLH
jgi:putative transposase